MKLLIGADPEFFVLKKSTYISGHTFQCGTKIKPMVTEHGSVQVDGLALEANVRPAQSEDEFVKNILGVRQDLAKIVRKHSKKCRLVAASTAHFGKDYLSKLPPEVLVLGCTPDYNAYTGVENPRPPAGELFRTGAGHIHFGWATGLNMSPDHFNDCQRLARQLDYYLGLPSTFWDHDHKRRLMYGKAGAFRPKSYGMEYRVLSNAWLNSEKLQRFVYKNSVRAFEALAVDKDLYREHGLFAAEVINTPIQNWANMKPALFKEIATCLSE